MTVPTLSVIIVNYNGKDIIGPCLDAVAASKTSFLVETIVIDNASTDGSNHLIAARMDTITFIQNSKNTGFCIANNEGASRAKGDTILLLNSDTITEPDAFETMLTYLQQNPHVSAVGPRLLNTDGSIQTQGSPLSKWRFLGDQPRAVPFVIFAAFMIKRRTFLDLGGLDSAIFFYNDDVDFCLRLRKEKKTIHYLPQARIVHIGGQSSKHLAERSIIEGYKGGLYLCKKHYPYAQLPYTFAVCIDVSIRWMITVLRSYSQPQHRPRADAYRKVLSLLLKIRD